MNTEDASALFQEGHGSDMEAICTGKVEAVLKPVMPIAVGEQMLLRASESP